MATLFNMVRMTCATAGTGTLTLAAAVPSFLSSSPTIPDGTTVSYLIEDGNGTGREVGFGTYGANGQTLTRNPLASTNGGAAISLSGNSQVAITALAQDITNKAGDTLTGALNWAPAVTLASASTVAIGAAKSNYIIISGTTAITAFDTIAQGAVKLVRFSGSLTLTQNATSFILPGGANIQTGAGDVSLWISEGSGNWRCVDYTSAAGLPLLSSNNLSDVANAVTAFTNISPMTSQGDLIIGGASNPIRLPIGPNNDLLTSNGTTAAWQTISAWLDAAIGSTPGLTLQRGASVWAGVAAGGAVVTPVTLTTSTQTLTIPGGATKALVILCGGGGGSGGCSGGTLACCILQPSSGGAGGSAAVLLKYLSGLTPGNTLALTIGGAGAAGASGANAGGNGGDSTLASGSQSISTLTAGGGKGGGGGGNGSAGTPGASGSATGGDLSINPQPAVGITAGNNGLGLGLRSLSGSSAQGTGYGVGANATTNSGPGGFAGAAGLAGVAIILWFA